MIHPTARAGIALAVAVPIALVVAFTAPGWWIFGVTWLAMVLLAFATDALILVQRRLDAAVQPPPMLYVGEPAAVTVALSGGSPVRVEVTVDVEGPAQPTEGHVVQLDQAGHAELDIEVQAFRRGTVRLARLWLRTEGPLGFAGRTARRALDAACPVVPNIAAVKRQALAFTQRAAPFGVKPQFEKGSGSEFEALRDYAAGLDIRTVDWKHSARHRKLVCKEFQTERNHHVILALDTGHLMAETVDGMAKLDHAISALLLMSYVSLKAGDKVGLSAFDARTRAFVAPCGGLGSMARLQRAFAGIDYRAEETNFTLALAELRGRLARRSLIVVATDFVDTVTADLMIDNIGYLARRHLIIFAALSDTSLEQPFAQRPDDLEDVARAVVAYDLVRERRAVFGKLARLGVLCIEATAERLGPALINRYLAVKARDLI